MSTGSPHLVLLTRVPVPGRVKTRLMGVLPGEQCAQLQRAFALDAVERLAPLGLPLTVRYSNEAADNPALLREFLAEVEKAWELGGGNGGLRLEPQRGDDLGARMASAIEDELARGAGGCLLTGSDLPFLGAGLLARALDAFGFEPAGAGLGPTETGSDPDVILGPTEDGGYWLVGLRQPFGELFAGKRYGSASVFDDALAACKAHGRSVVSGPATRDVDTPDDLRWLGGLVTARDPRVGRRTAQVVRGL